MSAATVEPTTTTAPADALLRRNRRFATFSVLCAVVLLAIAFGERAAEDATFVLNDARGQLFTLPDLVVPVTPVAVVLAIAIAAIAVVQVTRGFGTRTVPIVGLVAALFVLGFLAWAAAGGNLFVVGLLNGTIASATPIAFGALCGVLCERAGVINIAIEGQFLAAAFAAAIVATVFESPWFGLGGGIAASVLVAALLAVLAIRFRADQIVVGVVLIVFATGVTNFLLNQVLVADSAGLNSPSRFRAFEIPFLSDIPLLGPILFRQTILGFAMFATVLVLNVALFQTRWGLRLRSVGEKPRASDTVGINVLRTRYRAVLLGGVVAGIGGSWFTLDSVGQFSREMSAGTGFIALAAMLVGRYSPVGAFGAALLFGFASALATSLQLLQVPISSTLLLTAPYVVTMFVVAGLVGRLRAPAADGQPYVKE